MRMKISHQHRLDFHLKDYLLFRYLFVVLFCLFTTSESFAGEQFEVFGIHLDQNPDVIKSKIRDQFDKKWGCKDLAPQGNYNVFVCGGHNYFDSAIYYSYDIERSELMASCFIYKGCGGEDALEQVRRILEDRWNINFSEKQTSAYPPTKYFDYSNSSTDISLTKFSLRISHKNKNKNNPSFD
jgi:hypothetical protein